MSRNDCLIVLGDFGVVWNNSKEENYWLDWFEDKPWTTLFIDGNHQNFPLLYSYPVEQWNGGNTHVLRPHIRHLMRGEIFNLNGFSFFCLGGAKSVDKAYRVEGKSWWESELPTYQELDYAAKNLAAHNMSVDFILSHCGPTSLVKALMPNAFSENDIDPLMSFFEKYVKANIKFQQWLCAHYHQDRTLMNKYHILYNDIIEIMPDGTLEMRNN